MKYKVLLYQNRKMVVIKGQPYYQSTGQNSGSPGTWLPFIMINGSEALYAKNLPSHYNCERFNKNTNEQPNDYIIKYDAPMLHLSSQDKMILMKSMNG